MSVTASLDKTHYASHEQVRLKVTYTNNGSTPVSRLYATALGIDVVSGDWGDLGTHTGTLAAGETRTVEVRGSIKDLHEDQLIVLGHLMSDDGDVDQDDNMFRLTATVTQTRGTVEGLVFADANRNGLVDTDEPLAGAVVNIYGGSPVAEHRVTTDVNGRFVLPNVPAGRYTAYYEMPGGWSERAYSDDRSFLVEPNSTTGIVGRGERPTYELLKATGSLDRTTYEYPAAAKIALTLTNTSAFTLSGIQARCNPFGGANHLGSGAGWSELSVNGPGVTLAPGQSRSFEINEDIPRAALTAGDVQLNCAFQPNASFNGDGPRVTTTAKVRTNVAKFTVTFVNDKNHNQRLDLGEEISGLKVRVIRQDTGAKAGEFVSGPDGRILFSGVDLEPGAYWGVFDGPWSLPGGHGGMPIHINESGDYGAMYFLEAGTAVPELRGTIKFGRTSYQSHETVSFTATVTNIGGQTAEHVKLERPYYDMEISEDYWGEFAPSKPGITLASGETRTFEVIGTIREIRDGKLRLSNVIDYVGRPNPTNSVLSGEVAVVVTRGDVFGVVHKDLNRNGQADPGEEAADVVVDIGGGVPHTNVKTTSGADGKFSFTGLPSGQYNVSYTLADGWIVRGPNEVSVHPRKPSPTGGLAVRPYRETLSATMTLDKDEYRVGDLATVNITLTNSGDRAVSGIQAGCNRIGDKNQLGGRPGSPVPAGWAPFFGDGVTVGAGETRTFVVTEEVPPGAFEFGRVVVGCDFEPNAGWNDDGPSAGDSARVPGGFGSLKAHLVHDRNGNHITDPGEAIAGTRVALHDFVDGTETASAVTDADGLANFARVPAGEYRLKADGWKPESDWGDYVHIFDGSAAEQTFFVVPAALPEPGAGGGVSPQPGGGTGGGDGGGGAKKALAQTGASVLGLGMVAALLVAFGFGARLAGRRQT